MPKVQLNGMNLAYEVQGDGHPLLLIAGVGYSGWYWRKVVPGLAKDFRLITFDNRGAGDSDKPAGPYTVKMMAEDTIGLLDALGIESAHVMGHSLGGFIAQELIGMRPDLVSKLVLASTNHGGTNVIPITPEAMEVLTNREGDPMELVRRGIAIACAPGFMEQHGDVAQELIAYRFTNPVPPEQYQAQVAAGAGMAYLTAEQVVERTGAIQVPTLILFGEYDQVVPPGNAELMADLIPDSQIQIIPGVGHMFPIEDPETTIALLQDFLR
jgi:pimeloyl-ACP methyl ester carboxylesterase